ncbi:MAG: hypothetical protein IJZ08_07750 [Clostridia bacterium]|nr:hypothetical protein [Clostridia bacterium]
MGAYFSNLHIKKESVSEEDVKAEILACFAENGCTPSDSDTADFEVCLYAPADGRWLSVYCDTFECTDVLTLAPRISEKTGADVLALACFDSDYLFLNLVNVKDSRDLWLNIGDTPEIRKPRRSTLSAWKNSIGDFAAFRAAAKEKYDFADEFLLAVQHPLELPFAQSTGFEIPENVTRLYFSAPQNNLLPPTSLTFTFYDKMPCVPGKRSACHVNNMGLASRGIGVLFVGSYVEHDEITIDDAEFWYSDRRGEQVSVPIRFEKIQLSDGQWAYHWQDMDFKIPEAVSPAIPYVARFKQQCKRSFGIRYTPNGNKRKFLDITVVFAPLSNRIEGQCAWRVWGGFPSKRAYIEKHNESVKADAAAGMIVGDCTRIDPAEYDLD